MVSWDEVPAVDRNGLITVYEVLYEPLETFEGFITSDSINTTDMMLILTGLQEFVEYNISVRAYTSEGSGPYSEEITEMTLEDGKTILQCCDNIKYTFLSRYNCVMLCWAKLLTSGRKSVTNNYVVSTVLFA